MAHFVEDNVAAFDRAIERLCRELSDLQALLSQRFDIGGLLGKHGTSCARTLVRSPKRPDTVSLRTRQRKWPSVLRQARVSLSTHGVTFRSERTVRWPGRLHTMGRPDATRAARPMERTDVQAATLRCRAAAFAAAGPVGQTEGRAAPVHRRAAAWAGAQSLGRTGGPRGPGPLSTHLIRPAERRRPVPTWPAGRAAGPRSGRVADVRVRGCHSGS